MIGVHEVSLAIGGRSILDRVSFGVSAGESVALVGPNGSGKTSLLRCLLGLVPFTGRVTIGGHDVAGAPVAARTLVGYVPQKVAFGDARAREVLTFVAGVRGLDPACVAQALRGVGLHAERDGRVRTFSGGMQQRLGIAAALLGDPPVVLLDEPSASLDREGQEMFFALVARLRQAGRTLVLASHRREEVTALTDRVLELDGGRLASHAGAPATVIPFRGRTERR
jgi:ABC-type multidrug transport system ATPase subunit